MTSRRQWAVGILTAAMCWGFGTGLAVAIPSLSFDNPTVDGGTLTYDGVGGPAIGTGIIFQQVIGVDTPLNAGVPLFCTPGNCLLNLTTGANVTEGPTEWNFAGGGSLTMTGGLNTLANGAGVQVVAAGSNIIVSGSFSNLVQPGTDGAGDTLQFQGVGTDTKNTDLLAFYGLTNPLVFVTTELSLGQAVITTTGATAGAFSATVTDADFQNAQVPIPATLLLLGAGFTGIAVWGRKRARVS